MSLRDYIEARPQKKIKADIFQRWNERIEPRGLQSTGADGAQLYLRDYGKSIAAPKCLQFGALALQSGFTEFGHEFYRKAAQLEGVTLSDAGNPAITEVQQAAAAPHPGFPSGLQPGKFCPMQPVDGTRDQAFYIERPSYWGQPKIDGNKLIVFATPDQVFYQSRTGKLNGTPDAGMDDALRSAAREIGNFILEGELTYLDAEGKEHRTGSQAARANIELGHPSIQPDIRYCVFAAPWMASDYVTTYGDMVKNGHTIAAAIQSTGCDIVQPIVTARTTEEKCALVEKQKAEEREGEVWFQPLMRYEGGKPKDERYVRTKYLCEFEALCVGFTDTTAEGHAFGAMLIQSLDGSDLGSVGTSFTRQDKKELLRRFEEGGPFKVRIISQGFTEGPERKAWHARFEGIVE
jgi:bifunctional non-homologous end joining protein LigD